MSEDGRTPYRINTLAVHGGEKRPGPAGSLVFPIFQGTVYATEAGTGYHDQKYIRLNSTPTQVYLHEKLAALESAEAALGTGSGMGALTAILATLLGPGDHVLAGDVLYGGTHDFLTQDAQRFGWSCTFVDPHRPETWGAAVRPRTRLFLVETITNPLVRVPRLREVVAFCRERGLISVVDNTLASPVNFRPVTQGFDLAYHSATKYLNGHSDLVAGCVVGRKELVDRVRVTLNHIGATLDPHAAFLLARGLKTLGLRVRAQNAGALALARFLSTHPGVLHVNYPGLETHPDHTHAKGILSGFGGLLSLRPKGGDEAAARLLSRVRLPYVAPSLGGIETLMTRPCVTSHAGMGKDERETIGITDDLVRVAVGIEDPEDLVEDFRQALD